MRVEQNRELVATGAGDKFDLEQAEANVNELEGQLATARGDEAQVAQKLAGAGRRRAQQVAAEARRARCDGEYAQVAQIRAQLENARWELDQTTRLRAGRRLRDQPAAAAGRVRRRLPVHAGDDVGRGDLPGRRALRQNELHQVEPGNEAEFALKTYPGRIIKAKVDSIVWAQGQGQVRAVGHAAA